MLVSYVPGEGVELTLHKEIKEVELRSGRVRFIFDRNRLFARLDHVINFR